MHRQRFSQYKHLNNSSLEPIEPVKALEVTTKGGIFASDLKVHLFCRVMKMLQFD